MKLTIENKTQHIKLLNDTIHELSETFNEKEKEIEDILKERENTMNKR